MRSLRLRVSAAGFAVLLVGAAATAARAQDDQPGSERYRLATAEVGDVEETLSVVGTVRRTATSDAVFATDGSVARVLVEVGDRVRAGQPLARLDSTSLRAAVTAAEAALAEAKAQLEADLEAQSRLVDDAASPEQPQQPPQPQQPRRPDQPRQPEQPAQPDPDLVEVLKRLAEQQRAVRDAQTRTTEAIASAKAALATQQQACAVTEDQPTPSADCDVALQAVRDAQDAVAAAQDALQAAIAALSDTLSAAIATLGGQSADTAAVADGGDSVVVPALAIDAVDESGPGDAGDQASVSAGTIAQDQAAIDQARATLAAARRALAATVLRSPRSGTVVSVGIAPGDRVSTGSAAVTVVGKGSTTVSASVTVEQVDSLDVGQKALVTVPGRRRQLAGKVTAIGLLPATGDDTTYPVTVTLSDGSGLPSGSSAGVAVVVDTAENVVTVPVSAVADGFVRVLSDGRAVRRKVTVGAVGRTTIEVTGIEAGTTVILADRQAELPSGQQDGLGGPFGGGGRFSGPGGAGGPTVVRIPG